MQKRVLLSRLIAMAGVLLLAAIAYSHSLAVSRMYDQRMREDIQECARQLTKSGVATAQVRALQSVLNEVNHHTLSYVASEADSIIGTAAFMGIIIISLALGFSSPPANKTSHTKQ